MQWLSMQWYKISSWNFIYRFVARLCLQIYSSRDVPLPLNLNYLEKVKSRRASAKKTMILKHFQTASIRMSLFSTI